MCFHSRFTRMAVLCVAALSLAAASGACSKKSAVKGAPAEFEADVHARIEDDAFEGKIFVAKDKMRTEMPGATIIARLDKGVIWMLMPDQRIYTEMQLDPNDQLPLAVGQVPGETKRRKLGVETIEGRPATKFEVTAVQDGADTLILQWIDTDTGVPVKTAASDGSWVQEYRNAKVGPQSAELFEAPADYQKLLLPDMSGLSPTEPDFSLDDE